MSNKSGGQDDDAFWEKVALQQKLKYMTPVQLKNNPKAEPMGDYTGRCAHCGSKNLWDDDGHYGCYSCGAVLA